MSNKIYINDLNKIEINSGDLVIDCGANLGTVTDYFVSRGAKVIAFEPNEYAYTLLEKKFRDNPNVTTIKKGVAGIKYTGKVKLYLHEESIKDQILYSSGSSILKDKNNVNENDFQIIEIIDLCKFIRSLYRPIKVLKIDIEGAEIELINDLIDQGIAQIIPYIIVETHEKKIPSLLNPTMQLKKRIKKEKLNNINMDWV